MDLRKTGKLKTRDRRRHKLSNEKLEQQVFLKTYCLTVSVKHALAAAKVTDYQFRTWLNNIPEFRARWEEIQDSAAQVLEDEAVRRAVEGCKRPIYYRGEPIIGEDGRPVYELQFSDTLLVTLLKRFRPLAYREHQQIEHSGSLDLVQRLATARNRLIALNLQRDAPTGTGHPSMG